MVGPMRQPAADRLEPTACFDLLLAGYDRARRASESPRAVALRVGCHTVRLDFASDALADALIPALAHLEVADAPDADLTVQLWDTQSTGEPLSPLLELLRERIYLDPHAHLSTRHEIVGFSNGRVPATLEMGSGVLSILDRELAHAVYWVADATGLPSYERAAPLRTLLSWWLSDLGYQSIHAAAVGREDGGVLLAGPGGSGKSTTALRCLDAGLGYAADDYCTFRSGSPPVAFSLYNTAKLNGIVDLQRQPRFLPLVENPDAAGHEKLIMYVGAHFPDQIVRSFPILAVVVPRVADDGQTTLAEATSGAALRALGPTSLFLRPGAGGDALSAMADLVRHVPCFELRLGAADPAPHIAALLDR